MISAKPASSLSLSVCLERLQKQFRFNKPALLNTKLVRCGTCCCMPGDKGYCEISHLLLLCWWQVGLAIVF